MYILPAQHVQHAEFLESALSTLPESDKAALCAVVAMKFVDRFDRTGSMHDLDLAIITNEQAIASIPDDHPEHAAILNNLGRAAEEIREYGID